MPRSQFFTWEDPAQVYGPGRKKVSVTKELYYLSLHDVVAEVIAGIEDFSIVGFSWPASIPISSSPAAAIYEECRKGMAIDSRSYTKVLRMWFNF